VTKSLLQIVQAVALRCNYGGTPTTAFANTDPGVQLMVQCALEAGDEAVERVNWEKLKTQVPLTFTGDGVTAVWPLPTGFQSLGPSTTFISSAYPTLHMPGPVNEEDLLVMKLLPVTAQPSVWRMVGGDIEFFPVLQLSEVASYVPTTGSWITSSTGTPYSPVAWQADTDLPVVPSSLIIKGATWRWKWLKGLDYAEAKDDFEATLDRLSGQESTGRVIPMSTRMTFDSDTWFPGSITDLTDQAY
jgi:hypothetical protein